MKRYQKGSRKKDYFSVIKRRWMLNARREKVIGTILLFVPITNQKWPVTIQGGFLKDVDWVLRVMRKRNKQNKRKSICCLCRYLHVNHLQTPFISPRNQIYCPGRKEGCIQNAVWKEICVWVSPKVKHSYTWFTLWVSKWENYWIFWTKYLSGGLTLLKDVASKDSMLTVFHPQQ